MHDSGETAELVIDASVACLDPSRVEIDLSVRWSPISHAVVVHLGLLDETLRKVAVSG